MNNGKNSIAVRMRVITSYSIHYTKLYEVRGSFALGIVFKDFEDTIFAVRKESPLIVGVGDGENFIASDVPAILKYTKKYYLLESDELAISYNFV